MADFSCITALPNLQLVQKIGEGGMSTVWKAFDSKLNKIVAVKILNHDLAKSGTDIGAFCAEEKKLESIHHPGIVEAYSHDYANGLWYFTMEYVDGYTFADYLKRKTHVSEADCLLICESVAVALDYAWTKHRLVHCDLKPENIMVNREGVVKLMDLGISHQNRRLKPSQLNVTDQVLGTPAYISPEQVYGDVEPDLRADIYALAATLYHLATGRILFPALSTEDTMRAHCDVNSQANDPRFYQPELSDGFARMLESMLVKDRDKRIASWQTVLKLCSAVEAGRTFAPRKSSSPSSIKLQ